MVSSFISTTYATFLLSFPCYAFLCMGNDSVDTYAGIRMRPEGCTAVLLGGRPLTFVRRERYTFLYGKRTCVERMPGLARFVGTKVVDTWSPEAVAVVTLTPGMRLRGTSIDRGHLDGVALWTAKNTGVTTVLSVSSVHLKRLIPLLRMQTSAAISTLCRALSLRTGRDGQLTRDQFDLEAIGAALFAASSMGVALPAWAEQPRAAG